MYPEDNIPLGALVGTADDPRVDALVQRHTGPLAASRQTRRVALEPLRAPNVAMTVIVVDECQPVREVA
jgi:hypothetical protein